MTLATNTNKYFRASLFTDALIVASRLMRSALAWLNTGRGSVPRSIALTAGLVCAFAAPFFAARASDAAARRATAPDGATLVFYPLGSASGTPLLVVAAGPGNDARYLRVGGAFEQLARTRQVIFYDQRGTGQSADSNGEETVAQFVADLEAVRAALQAPQIDLLGHSFGGYLAMAYTAKYPTRVRSLVLVDTLPPKSSDRISLMKDLYPDRIEQWRKTLPNLGKNARNTDTEAFQSMAFVDADVERSYSERIAAYRFNAEVGKTVFTDAERLDYWPQVRQFQQPTLILHGRFDAVVAPANSWALHQAIGGSRLHLFETAGHVPSVERPDEFLSVVRQFLAEMDRATTQGVSKSK